MSVFSDIPENIRAILLKDEYFSNGAIIKAYSSNANPNPMTKIYISIELESVNVKNLSSPIYLGTSNGCEYFGNYTEAVIMLDIYSPKSIGSDGCYNTFSKICELLSNDNTYNINHASCGKISYDDDTFCFKSSCKLDVNLFMARLDLS